MTKQDLQISDDGRPTKGEDWLAPFDFALPESLIARTPAEPRGASRLLVCDRTTGSRTATEFQQLEQFLQPGDLLVANETRVLPARLKSQLERTGRGVEILLAHPESDETGPWWAMLGPSRRLRAGDRLLLEETDGAFEILAGEDNGLRKIRAEGGTAIELMERAGHLPIPPYLRREDCADDRRWYQTVFASSPGAIAAPTAGLHFSTEHLGALGAAGIAHTAVTLHVGPGTFLPVRAESAETHRVLPERYIVSPEAQSAIETTKAAGGRVVAVGTTVVRALESWARAEDAAGWTDLTITPGYSYGVVDALLTNFHLPRSSLLLLVAALLGRDELIAAYEDAIAQEFRFYSYGDAMLVR